MSFELRTPDSKPITHNPKLITHDSQLNPMSWNQLTIDVPDDMIDAVVGELSGYGIEGVWESHAPESGLTRLVLYFGVCSNLERIETEVRTLFVRAGRQNPAI